MRSKNCRKVHEKGCHPKQMAIMYQHTMIVLKLVTLSGSEVQKGLFYKLDVCSGAEGKLYSGALNGTPKL